MKKIIIITLLLLSVSAFGEEFTFRGLRWGATLEEVIAEMGQPDKQFLEEFDRIFYPDINIAGYKANLYLKSGGKRHGAVFRLQEASYLISSTNSEIEEIFLDIISKLSILYGLPNIDDTGPFWVVDRTLIKLNYRFDNNFPNSSWIMPARIIIRYESPEINGYGEL